MAPYDPWTERAQEIAKRVIASTYTLAHGIYDGGVRRLAAVRSCAQGAFFV